MKITIEFDPTATAEVSYEYSNSKTNTIRKMLEQVADRIDGAIWSAGTTRYAYLMDRNNQVMGSVKIRLADEEKA